MEKTLYVSDLDGTLLNRQSKISERSLAVLNSLIDRGLPFTYATARSLQSARVVTAGLRVNLPVVVYNGTFLMDPVSGAIKNACTFTDQERSDAMERFQSSGVTPLVYTVWKGRDRVLWYRGAEKDPRIKKYLDSRKGDPRLIPADAPEAAYRGEIFYYTCIGSHGALADLAQVFQQDARYTCLFQREIYTDDEYWLEVMPKHATKAEGIHRLKELCGYDRIVSFGDALNDIPMFRGSDEAYSVENAVPALKAAASGIIGSNEEDGVANWLLENCSM